MFSYPGANVRRGAWQRAWNGELKYKRPCSGQGGPMAEDLLGGSLSFRGFMAKTRVEGERTTHLVLTSLSTWLGVGLGTVSYKRRKVWVRVCSTQPWCAEPRLLQGSRVRGTGSLERKWCCTGQASTTKKASPVLEWQTHYCQNLHQCKHESKIRGLYTHPT